MGAKANLGDLIKFTRNGFLLEGVVLVVNENSVIVELDIEDAGQLHLENNKTVVNHKNYKVLWVKENAT